MRATCMTHVASPMQVDAYVDEVLDIVDMMDIM